MGIQSTSYITREEAIDRIREIAGLFVEGNYKEIEELSFEDGPDVQSLSEFAAAWTPIDTSNLEGWTNEMLGDYMDNSFFRYSMFDNYSVWE